MPVVLLRSKYGGGRQQYRPECAECFESSYDNSTGTTRTSGIVVIMHLIGSLLVVMERGVQFWTDMASRTLVEAAIDLFRCLIHVR